MSDDYTVTDLNQRGAVTFSMWQASGTGTYYVKINSTSERGGMEVVAEMDDIFALNLALSKMINTDLAANGAGYDPNSI